MFRLITRIAIGLTLVLSIGALVMAVLLFQQRETLKGRTQKLEETIHKVAATLEVEGATNEMIKVADDQLKTFKARPGGPPTMDQPLGQVVGAAQNQLVRLNNTHVELADTRTTLAQTQDELKNTKTELVAAREKIKPLEDTIETKNNVISQKEAAIAKLAEEKTELIAQADSLKVQLDEMESEKGDFTDQVAILENQVGELESIVFPKAMTKGQQGIVTYVNPEWNFLIVRLDPASITITKPDLELLVYRADKLVGKVRIESVVDNLAVAEIINDWQQLAPQNGDGILY